MTVAAARRCSAKMGWRAGAPTDAPSSCEKCVVNKKGVAACCAKGASWEGMCSNDVSPTFTQGVAACAAPAGAPTDAPSSCETCKVNWKGISSCCVKGASWEGKCSSEQSPTWAEGLAACATQCEKCKVNKKGVATCCAAKGAAWEGKCSNYVSPTFAEGVAACAEAESARADSGRRAETPLTMRRRRYHPASAVRIRPRSGPSGERAAARARAQRRARIARGRRGGSCNMYQYDSTGSIYDSGPIREHAAAGAATGVLAYGGAGPPGARA